MNIPLKKDLTYFAKTNFRNIQQTFGIKRKDRRQHMYILGKSGSGKSAMIKNMCLQDMLNGEGLCVVDPHGELVEELLELVPPERMKDVVYFNPADSDHVIGFNVLELTDPQYKNLVASGLMGIFTKMWANVWSARMEYILSNCVLALLDTPGTTLLGITRILVDKSYREQIISNVQDPVVKAFWTTEFEAWQEKYRTEAIAPIQNKVGQFLSSSVIRNIVGQEKSTVDIFDIMNSKKIFLVNVSKGRIGEQNSGLLGGMIITKLQLAAMERVRIPEEQRADFYLYVDEFQNFATESFASILSEARKYRLCLILAHQYINQLITDSSTSVRDAAFGNAGTMIVFRVGAQDAEYLRQEFEPEFEPQDFVMLPNFNIYLKLMVDGMTMRPFSAITIAPLKIETSRDVVKQIIDTTHELYTTPRFEVEERIREWAGQRNSFEDSTQSKNTEGKFKAQCSVCNRDVFVPFEPREGLPIYCKEHLAKVQSGEIPPVKIAPLFKKPVKQDRNELSQFGIEFENNEEIKDVPMRNGNEQSKMPQQIQRTVNSPILRQESISAQLHKIENYQTTKIQHGSSSVQNKSLPQKNYQNINRSTNQSVGKPLNKFTNQSVGKPINQSINQSINRPHSQSQQKDKFKQGEFSQKNTISEKNNRDYKNNVDNINNKNISRNTKNFNKTKLTPNSTQEPINLDLQSLIKEARVKPISLSQLPKRVKLSGSENQITIRKIDQREKIIRNLDKDAKIETRDSLKSILERLKQSKPNGNVFPEKTPEKSQEKIIEKSPEKTPEKSPEKTPEKSPEKTIEISSQKLPDTISEISRNSSVVSIREELEKRLREKSFAENKNDHLDQDVNRTASDQKNTSNKKSQVPEDILRGVLNQNPNYIDTINEG